MAGIRDKICACCGLKLGPKKFGKNPGGSRKNECLDCEDLKSQGLKTITSADARISQRYLLQKW